VIVGLDTSVLLRLLCGEPEELAVVALRYLRERQRAGDRVLLSDWVLAETYCALQHHYGSSKKEALRALRELLASPGIEGSADAVEILATARLESARPGFVDRLIHADYRRSAVGEMATFERASARLSAVRVLGR
jgi:predicted nucleic-acid-binding protein